MSDSVKPQLESGREMTLFHSHPRSLLTGSWVWAPCLGLSPKPCSAAPSECISAVTLFFPEPLPQGLPGRWRGQLSKAGE